MVWNTKCSESRRLEHNLIIRDYEAELARDYFRVKKIFY